MRTFLITLAVSSAMAAGLSAPAQAAVVLGISTTVTNLGTFAAGTYNITASGVVNLTSVLNEFSVGPNGVPTTPVTINSYSYCNPNGCTTDTFNGGIAGPGGSTIKLGALIGTLNAAPTLPSDYFLIGNGTTITLSAPGNIFALVNDTAYSNNFGSYTVNVTSASGAVPEPATWALMLGGFGLMGGALRSRRQAVQVSYC